jgi:hypothetical protein
MSKQRVKKFSKEEAASRRRYTEVLASRGIACGVARVARLMKTVGFRAIQPKSYRLPPTKSRHSPRAGLAAADRPTPAAAATTPRRPPLHRRPTPPHTRSPAW